MSPLPISVCLIAGAEALRIRRPLESVSGWTGEIIVVLNEEVNDGTDQIAQSFGARVFREPWKGYVGQKNSAAQKAGQEWILSLDADEVVSPGLRDELQKIFSDPEKLRPFAAYSFPRCTFYGGRWIRHGDWYPDRKVRLWRRGSAEWRGENVHETVVVQGAVGKCKNDLQHYSMDDLNHHVRKSIQYSDLFAKRRLNEGRLATGVMELGFRPWWRFVRGYILRLGFLDGWQGFVIARMVAFETFLRYAKVREAQARSSDQARP
jgi:glycosyltransferase involved in cell wall biosynthesis